MSSLTQVSLLLLLIVGASAIASQQQCQAITYYECKNIGYNQTSLPNRFNHQDQKDVALVVSSKCDIEAFSADRDVR